MKNEKQTAWSWFYRAWVAVVACWATAPTASGEGPSAITESYPSPATVLETRGVGDGVTLWVGSGTAVRYDTSWAGAGTTGVTITETSPGGAVSTLLSLEGEAAGDIEWSPVVPGVYTLVQQSGTAAALTARIQFLGTNAVLHYDEMVSGNAIWSAGCVHVVRGTVTVADGATLAIASGAVVKFTEGSSLVVESGGGCVASGVVFTPIADDTVGGDTMGDGDASRPAADSYSIPGNMTTDEWTEQRWLTSTGLKWSYNLVDGGAVITGIPSGTSGAVLVPRTLGGHPVTGIGDSAFKECGKLTMVVIQAGVKSIGAHAFDGCSRLSEVWIPDGLECIGDEAFAGCNLMARISLPDSLVDWGLRSLPVAMQGDFQYGENGFMVFNGWVLGYRDSEVATLEIPAGMVGIGNHALADFWDLERVGMPDSLRFIGRGAFETNTYLDNVVIPAGVEWVRDGAFQGCTYIRNLTIGESVGYIGRRAFAGCSQLATVDVPESVREIGDGAFSNCWRMLSVKLPLGLAEAGTGIFAGCQSLTGVTMPTHAFTAKWLFEERYAALESVTVVEGETALCNGVFEDCTALASATLPEGISEIGDLAFAGCRSLPEIEMPGTVGRIGDEAFKECKELRAIVLPDSVEDMGSGAFKNCSNLANATLSRSLKAVPDEAFAGCRQLTSMVVPASVKRLGKGIGEWFQGLYLLGNAPEYDEETYTPRIRSLTTYVVQGSRGWDGIPSSRDLPAAWIGNPITFWEPNRFDAHFDANGGEFIDGSAVWSCEQITGVGYVLPPYVPTLEGAEFDGWWTDPSEGAQIKVTTRVNETREITFYAHWKGSPVPVTVRFNANGGTVTPAEGTYTATMPYGELPVPTRAHYSFRGWWTAAEGGRQIVASSRVPGADQELFAHWVWSPEEYVVQFHANGGEGAMANQHFIYGNVVTLHTNAFQRDGWVFEGWALSEDGAAVYADGATLAQVAVNEEGILHLYAAWRGGTYAVRFDANGGVGRMDNQTFEIGKAEALSLCQFSREGFRFLGWALTSGGEVVHEDGATVLDLTTEPDASVVLYAVWEKLPEPEALPEIADDSEVAGVLATAADTRLGEHIQTVAAYRDFREWALSVKGSDGELAGAAAVLASEHAWPSYLLGAERLFENEPEISLGGFDVGQSNGTKAAGGTSMFVSVTVKDGEKVADVDAVKVAALFECTGDLSDWTGEAAMEATATQTGEEGDTLRFEVVPEDGAVARAFLRIGE